MIEGHKILKNHLEDMLCKYDSELLVMRCSDDCETCQTFAMDILDDIFLCLACLNKMEKEENDTTNN